MEPDEIRRCQYVGLPMFLHIICYGYNVLPDAGRSNKSQIVTERNLLQDGITMLFNTSSYRYKSLPNNTDPKC